MCGIVGAVAEQGNTKGVEPLDGAGEVEECLRSGRDRDDGVPGERAEVMLAGFFIALGTFGILGMGVLAFWQPAAPDGQEGFVLRGMAWPTGRFLFWTFVQAAGSLIGVGMMIRAYQVADAGRVAILEYVILPASAFWTWALWGETLGPLAVAGILLIFAAGLIIALRGRPPGPR